MTDFQKDKMEKLRGRNFQKKKKKNQSMNFPRMDMKVQIEMAHQNLERRINIMQAFEIFQKRKT